MTAVRAPAGYEPTGGAVDEAFDADGAVRPAYAGVLAALEELERDYRVGNVAASDYRALRAELAGSAVLALKDAEEEERALDALIEREVAALRGQRAAPAGRE
ncbi:MAG: hypothetical protein KY433_07940, partial [Actinobacteria bacterium]|nr:hypothetical protein [Actinomycetota bacterium]